MYIEIISNDSSLPTDFYFQKIIIIILIFSTSFSHLLSRNKERERERNRIWIRSIDQLKPDF
jgi:predicted kinase